MFKKGQLVETIYGVRGVIIAVSDKVEDLYFIISPSGNFGMRSCGSELKLIGNNFKFKGTK